MFFITIRHYKINDTKKTKKKREIKSSFCFVPVPRKLEKGWLAEACGH